MGLSHQSVVRASQAGVTEVISESAMNSLSFVNPRRHHKRRRGEGEKKPGVAATRG